VSEEVNRKWKCPAMNTTVQLSNLYADPEGRNTLRHRQTDRQTDGWTDSTIGRDY